jgi:hypothetical protein
MPKIPSLVKKELDNAAFKANAAGRISARLKDMFSRFVPASTSRLMQ